MVHADTCTGVTCGVCEQHELFHQLVGLSLLMKHQLRWQPAAVECKPDFRLCDGNRTPAEAPLAHAGGDAMKR